MPDLPRRRSPQRPSWTAPIAARLTPAIKAMVIASALIFFFYVFAKSLQAPMKEHLGLGPGLFRGEVWQPVTALFAHFDIWGFLMNMVGLWFVGAYIERERGTRRFLALFFGAGILANLTIAGISYWGPDPAPYPFDGCSFAILALFVGYGRLFGREQVRLVGALVMQARVLALIFVAFSALVAATQGMWGHLAATFVVAIVGYLGVAPGGLRELYDFLRVRRLRRRYRVLQGGAGAGPARRARSPKYWN